ncbi:MAG: hypothetical protein ABIT36_00240 [Steroidobacteraceae bacterium]
MTDRDLNLDDDLDDYETGFIDALLYQQGISKPTREQFAAAMRKTRLPSDHVHHVELGNPGHHYCEEHERGGNGSQVRCS